jgi:Tfp pilus assembly protein PilF
MAQAEIPKLRKEAEHHFLKAIEIDQTQVDSRLQLGMLYTKVNLVKRAAAQFEEVLRWDPGNSTAGRMLAELASGEGSGKTPSQ